MKKRYWLLCGLILFGISKLGETPSKSGVTTQSPSFSTGVRVSERPPPATSDQQPTSPSATTASPRDETPRSSNFVEITTKFVNGNGVALRGAPSPKSQIIDRLDRGRKVDLFQSEAQWSRIKDVLTQKEGWVATRFLQDDNPKRKEISKPSEPKSMPPSTLSPTIIIQRIIAESLADYPGTCACPYSTDRRGRRCGNRSAYSKPGGYAPICFAQDVTKSMIEAYR
ncbi:SH3 domain-containing protein [Agrobacterium sp. FDAARGOS_525]|uniref:SH3 domain-containing protein n=1 Tax=Agrobacterium sp. FDAARGOS_525 TaxID=2420311 RepID=UPI000F681447|nr:SH3 domain-containing protein [Agrobacterium sp. FDAARGOS_525]RSC31579.1 SH3 domain-containing protein [Agrobacterium sp. FDAARGOS_525]